MFLYFNFFKKIIIIIILLQNNIFMMFLDYLNIPILKLIFKK
jgi:hypothetical protein